MRFDFSQSISAYSGHYRPTDESLYSFLSFLKENGVNLTEDQVINHSVLFVVSLMGGSKILVFIKQLKEYIILGTKFLLDDW